MRIENLEKDLRLKLKDHDNKNLNFIRYFYILN